MTREAIISLIKGVDLSSLCGCTLKQEDNFGTGLTMTMRITEDSMVKISQVDTGEQIVDTTVYEFKNESGAYTLSSFKAGESEQRLKKVLTDEEYELRKSAWKLAVLSAVLGGSAIGNVSMPEKNFSDVEISDMDGITMITYCLNCQSEGVEIMPSVAVALQNNKLIAVQGGYSVGSEVIEIEWSPIYEQQAIVCPNPDDYTLIDDLVEKENI